MSLPVVVLLCTPFVYSLNYITSGDYSLSQINIAFTNTHFGDSRASFVFNNVFWLPFFSVMLKAVPRLALSSVVTYPFCRPLPYLTYFRAMSTTAENRLGRIAVCQVTSSCKKDENFNKFSELIVQAKNNGAKVCAYRC